MFTDVEGPAISFKNEKKASETNEMEIQTDDYEIELDEAIVQTNDRTNGSTQTNVKDILSNDDFNKNSTIDDSKSIKILEFLNNVYLLTNNIIKYI